MRRKVNVADYDQLHKQWFFNQNTDMDIARWKLYWILLWSEYTKGTTKKKYKALGLDQETWDSSTGSDTF